MEEVNAHTEHTYKTYRALSAALPNGIPTLRSQFSTLQLYWIAYSQVQARFPSPKMRRQSWEHWFVCVLLQSLSALALFEDTGASNTMPLLKYSK